MSEQDFLLFRRNIHALDKETQRRLFLKFREWIYRDVYFLLNDHALTEDAIQEAFMKALRGGPNTREDSRMGAWLKQLARNTAYDLLRKNKKYRQMVDVDTVTTYEEPETAAAWGNEVDRIVETTLRDETLRETIGELKPEYRMALLLHYLKEMTYAETAAELGITEQVLTQRLARARRKLAEQFKAKWGDTR